MSGSLAVRHGPSLGGKLRCAARLALCAAVSWYLCLWWGTSTAPVPAALPAVLILREDVYVWPRLGRERLAGVLVGVLLSTGLLHWVTDPGWAFPLVLVCGCAGTYLLGRPGSPNQQVLISALMVYATAVPGYPLARFEESLVGIAVVVVLAPLLWPPAPFRTAAEQVDGYRTGVTGLLSGIAGALERGTTGGGAGAPTAALSGPLPERARLWLGPQAGRDAFDRASGRRYRLLRRAGRPPEGLDGRLVLAVRSASALQHFTDELRERARRDTAGGVTAPSADASAGRSGDRSHDPASRALAPLVRATADALDRALLGEDFAAPLDRARALDRAHRRAYPGRRDAVLRAGLHLTHEALTRHRRLLAGAGTGADAGGPVGGEPPGRGAPHA
ncbi:hypothetical protein [Streptomyces sp. NPDC097619]|uniref:FUSC family protein n=1 Tax=Streptomyces sp. NPDC097619 TaxID=3157228 RepID=UPI003330BFCB